MKIFAAADHVIGLDVDRDRFDKFVFRDSISSLLAELWKDEGSASHRLPRRPTAVGHAVRWL